MSTEIRFTSGSFSEVAGDAQRLGGDIAAERDHGAGRPRGPLGPQRVDVDLHVVGRRVAPAEGTQPRSAFRSPGSRTPGSGHQAASGGEGELVAAGIDQRAVGSRWDRDRRPACLPCSCRAPEPRSWPQRRQRHRSVSRSISRYSVIGMRITGAHLPAPCRSAAGRPAAGGLELPAHGYPHGEETGLPITAGPCPPARPDVAVPQRVHRYLSPPAAAVAQRPCVPPDWAGEAPGSPSAPIATCGSGAQQHELEGGLVRLVFS